MPLVGAIVVFFSYQFALLLTCYLCNGEANAYESVSEGHDCRYVGEPCEVVKVGYLA